jgi:hypothetical protein
MTKRILIVEDQEDLRGVLRDLFMGSGYVVMEAADGAAGIASAKSDRPELARYGHGRHQPGRVRCPGNTGCSREDRGHMGLAPNDGRPQRPAPGRRGGSFDTRGPLAVPYDASFANSGGHEEPGFPGGGPSVFGHCPYCQ